MGADGIIAIEPYAYLHDLIAMPLVAIVFLVGVVLVLAGIAKGLFGKKTVRGIWPAGIGTVMTVLALLLAGWNNTCYYPSLTDAQSSLCLANSSSSEFTLTVMSIVSILVPFVLAYIIWAWHAIDKKDITHDELAHDDHKY